MDQWDPEDVEAHFAFLEHVGELLEENGEFVDVQALTPAQTWVRYGGPDAAPVTTDGPLPETSDLVAGWYMVDVDSRERALEIAAYISSEPGPGGDAAARVDRRPGGHVPRAGGRLTDVVDEPTPAMDEGALRALVPRVLAGWCGGARTSTPPRTRCRRRCWRHCGCGPSTRRATRARG